MKTKQIFNLFDYISEHDLLRCVTLKEIEEEIDIRVNEFGADRSDFEIIPVGEVPDLEMEYYSPSDSMEYYDYETDTYYNRNGRKLRHPSEYNVYSEGYTPFGDE
jgi:hypothetical protein